MFVSRNVVSVLVFGLSSLSKFLYDRSIHRKVERQYFVYSSYKL